MAKPAKPTEAKPTEGTPPDGGLENLPVLVAVRTALAGQQDGIFRELPSGMYGCTVQDALDYALGSDLRPEEQPWARSIRAITGKGSYSVAVGDNSNVGTGTPLSGYTVVMQHPHPRAEQGASEHLVYRFADIRVSAPQRGGLECIARS